MNDPQVESGQRVTPLELFFDLVFVFAITQVTGFIADSPTWVGLLRGLMLLGALWWAWGAYAWLTNTLNPEEGAVRLAVFGSIAAMLIVSLATPHAFGSDGVIFGVAYFIVRALHLVLYAIAGRNDRELLRAVARIVPSAILARDCWSWPVSSRVPRRWRCGPRLWRSTTSECSSATCRDGASHRSTSSSATGWS
jgi:low temperature requirement protein LtrA